MQVYDISVAISATMPIWPGDPIPNLGRISRIEEGAEANVTYIQMGAHSGTHIDAPFHFLGDGYATVDRIPLDLMLGPAYVADFPGDLDMITSEALVSANIPQGVERLLLKTRNSEFWQPGSGEFRADYTALTPDAASELITKGIRVLGMDYLSVAPFADPAPTHRILLKAGVLIIESLDLSQVESGYYDLYCLPLKLMGTDGAPARVILIGS